MHARSLYPTPVTGAALAVTRMLPVMLMLAAALPLPVMAATEGAGAASAAVTGTPSQTGHVATPDASAAASFRHIPPGPLHGTVGKELTIPVARGGADEGDYIVQAVLLPGPGKAVANAPDVSGAPGRPTTEPTTGPAIGPDIEADITVDGRTVHVTPRQPGVLMLEVRGMREGPVS